MKKIVLIIFFVAQNIYSVCSAQLDSGLVQANEQVAQNMQVFLEAIQLAPVSDKVIINLAESEDLPTEPSNSLKSKEKDNLPEKTSPIEVIHDVAEVVHDATDVAQDVVNDVHDVAEFVEAATDPSGVTTPSGEQGLQTPDLNSLMQLIMRIKADLSLQGCEDAEIYDFFSRIGALKLTPVQIINFLKNFSNPSMQVDDPTSALVNSTSSNSNKLASVSKPLMITSVAATGVLCLIVGIIVGRFLPKKSTTQV